MLSQETSLKTTADDASLLFNRSIFEARADFVSRSTLPARFGWSSSALGHAPQNRRSASPVRLLRNSMLGIGTATAIRYSIRDTRRSRIVSKFGIDKNKWRVGFSKAEDRSE